MVGWASGLQYSNNPISSHCQIHSALSFSTDIDERSSKYRDNFVAMWQLKLMRAFNVLNLTRDPL